MSARRLRQFLSAVTAMLSIDEHVLVVTFLSPGELSLFERMPRFDQRHCLDVYHTLVRAGHDNKALLKAALLHDCGKVDDDGTTIPLLYYGIFVIMKRLTPALYQSAVEDGQGLLRPFAIHAAHDWRSAAMVEAVGGDPELVAILRDYAAQESTPFTLALGWADEQH